MLCSFQFLVTYMWHLFVVAVVKAFTALSFMRRFAHVYLHANELEASGYSQIPLLKELSLGDRLMMCQWNNADL